MLLPSHTEAQLKAIANNPTHGVLLSGPEGSGKGHAARYLAATLLKVDESKLANHPYFRIVSPDKGSLGIDQIRDFQQFIGLKTPGKDEIRRVAIIEDAQYMTIEAQNALLKSLEEPPEDTVIILTSPANKKLKETIYSRVRQISVLPVSKEQALEYFSGKFSQSEINKAYAMSSGRTGLMYALLTSDDHQLAAEISHAKELLGSSMFERLSRVDELAKQKDQLPLFLQACKLICSTALQQASGKSDTKQAKRWHNALSAVYQAEAALPSNPNTKLLMTDLMLQL